MIRFCLQCLKTKKACICKWITPISTEIELIILQHPTEAKRPLGTAKILSLSLANCRTFIGENFTEHSELNQLLSDDNYQHQVLFLDNTSQVISSASNTSEKKQRVILLDGTWKKAYKMWQLSTNLHSLPKVHLDTELSGNYRVRKAPKDNALSTAEAGYHVLSQLDNESTASETADKFGSILTAFDNMIEFHISQMPEGVYQKNYRSE
ncbi:MULTISPECIES: tRNA-uridine aminocarboxypropyltransferase [Aliivibrio]|uniref:tRNA-uridine aminocarboxypropyltransferase n=1 Tax=Aliivibrio finisterrensis TaxID=511998 RepID=A0A4Q5KU22_9GAMM|nr:MULTISPECIES: DTW domain-containing protein [Aliivibrio]MDD9179065.1 DTW domain-containing protein [Aliivibrio sp. A6]RYU51529.1 DTW domain-containing protein [Aliivibrio finisterrensis]RYU52754.1 DTW domain-containing protein [Aliivibrio finisterrensis]RYU58252.1 DTW domain-containing protein [Aliivibrio finisterrensis]RYU64068.1 DTW domain-containing protein [Aliivibrio finisterrensis]